MTAATAEPPTASERAGAAWPRPIRASAPTTVEPPTRDGPLLAVCGLAGGVGTTTLTYLIALAAAREWTEPVLVADTGGPSGALAAYAGVEVPRSLPVLAEQLGCGTPLRAGIYATRRDGLRVLASGPDFASPDVGDPLILLLAHAREAHGLTVIDCGTLTGHAEQAVAAAATHVAWVLPANRAGVQHGRRILDAAPRLSGRELLVARGDAGHSKAPLRDLRRVAGERRALLVLVPHLSQLARDEADRSAEEAQVPVQAILGALRR
jgi:MinD-like ATPase involved in chromosome partitioning or flagellar assembly